MFFFSLLKLPFNLFFYTFFSLDFFSHSIWVKIFLTWFFSFFFFKQSIFFQNFFLIFSKKFSSFSPVKIFFHFFLITFCNFKQYFFFFYIFIFFFLLFPSNFTSISFESFQVLPSTLSTSIKLHNLTFFSLKFKTFQLFQQFSF